MVRSTRDHFVLPLPEAHRFRWRSTPAARAHRSPTASSRRTISVSRRRYRADDLRARARRRAYVDDGRDGTLPRRASAADRLPVVAGDGRAVAALASAARSPPRAARAATKGAVGRTSPAARTTRFAIAAKATASSTTSPSRRAVLLAARCRHRAAPHRRRRLRRPPGQRHRGDLPRRPGGLHLLAARREELPVPQGDERPRRDARRRRPATRSISRALAGDLPTRARRGIGPDLVFYLAGADPYEGDRLGRLKLTIDGLRARDRMVVGALPRAVCRSPRAWAAATAVTSTPSSRSTPTPSARAMQSVPLLLSEADVRSRAADGDLIETMQRRSSSSPPAACSSRCARVLQVGAAHAFFGVMPAFVPASGALGTKLVTVFGSNAARGLPSHLATILLLDPRPAQLLAVMDGRYITEARTAAVSAVSARLLARPDAAVLALIGSGVQARSHLEALAHVRSLREVRVWSPRAAQPARVRRRACSRTRAAPMRRGWLGARCGRRRGPRRAVSRRPVSRSSCTSGFAPGTHICAVGACRPDQREMDSALVTGRALFVDSRAGGAG